MWVVLQAGAIKISTDPTPNGEVMFENWTPMWDVIFLAIYGGGLTIGLVALALRGQRKNR